MRNTCVNSKTITLSNAVYFLVCGFSLISMATGMACFELLGNTITLVDLTAMSLCIAEEEQRPHALTLCGQPRLFTKEERLHCGMELRPRLSLYSGVN